MHIIILSACRHNNVLSAHSILLTTSSSPVLL